MPELPEVETVRRGMSVTVVGARIEAVDVLCSKVVEASVEKLNTSVVGHRIEAVRRRGKLLIVDLDGDSHLLVHLMMTGQVVVYHQGHVVAGGGHHTPNILGAMPNDWTRIVFTLSGDRTIFISDRRKFGRIRVLTTAELAADPFLSRLGPEPLGDDFTVLNFATQLSRHRSIPIKAALLDQETVAGIGNVYADECLHVAGIDPRLPAGSITPKQVRRLHDAIQTVLREVVEHGGTSFSDYVNAIRQRETFLADARLFNRQGQPCTICGTSIERIRVAGRGTNYCPRCQRLHSPTSGGRGGAYVTNSRGW